MAAAPVAPPSWVEATRENLAKVGAETPFQVRDNGVEATVVLNQHDQLVFAEGRHLLPWTPSEMTLSIG